MLVDYPGLMPRLGFLLVAFLGAVSQLILQIIDARLIHRDQNAKAMLD